MTGGSSELIFFEKETLGIVQNLGPTDAEKRKDISAIIDALQRHVDGYLNEMVEWQSFHCWVQQPGESVDDFLISFNKRSCKDLQILFRELHGKIHSQPHYRRHP